MAVILKCISFKLIRQNQIMAWAFTVKYWSHVTSIRALWWLVNIGPGNSMVSSNNTALPGPMLNEYCDALYGISRQQWVNITAKTSTLSCNQPSNHGTQQALEHNPMCGWRQINHLSDDLFFFFPRKYHYCIPYHSSILKYCQLLRCTFSEETK